jgi:hypothetical protein
MTPEDLAKVGRLAMRHEGENWNAYYALPDTMEAPIFLGSIRMGAVTNNPTRKQAFMEMMRDIVGDIFEEKLGVRPSWGGPESAPEHERAGSG